MSPLVDYLPYNDVIENFRASKNSVTVRQIRKKIMALVCSDKFNGRISEYFSHPVDERYTLCFKPLRSDDTLSQNHPNKPTIFKKGDEYFLYGNAHGTSWTYTALDKTIVEAALKQANVALDVESELSADTSLNPIYEEILVKNAHTYRVSEPFLNFQNEPQQIAEYKKILNALYFLEVVFIDVETNGIGVLTNYIASENTTRNNAIKASQLLNIGAGVAEVFSTEIAQATQLLTKLYDYSVVASNAIANSTEGKEQTSIPYKIGFGSGVAIDQMQPDGTGNLDYDFLTNFTVVLPGYIDKVTLFLKEYTVATENGSTLSEQKLHELKRQGSELLTSLEKLQAGGSFSSLKLLNYFYVVGHIINLSQDILGQTGLLNETAQKALRERMVYLKMEMLPRFVEVSDKIETEFMTKPGLLSSPLMNSLIYLFEAWAVHYTKNIGNFDEKDESLLKLNDTQFMQARLDKLQYQVDEAEDKILKIQLAQEALEDFYNILDRLDRKKRLIDVSTEDKADLLKYFKLFEPYLAKSNERINQEFIYGLCSSISATSIAYDWTIGLFYNDPGLVSNVLSIVSSDSHFAKYLDKLVRSKKLQIEVIQDVKQHIERDSTLALFPYHRTTPILEASEKATFPTQRESVKFSKDGLTVANPDVLKQQEKLAIHRLYKNKCLNIEKAMLARETLLAILDANYRAKEQIVFGEHQKELKEKCMRLYAQIQPFLVEIHQKNAKVIEFDKIVVELLCGSFREKKSNKRQSITPESFHILMNHDFLNHMERVAISWQDKADEYSMGYTQSVVDQLASTTLGNRAKGDRAAYIIKHTESSKYLSLLRDTLTDWTEFLDPSLKTKLVQAKRGVPFPEIDKADDLSDVLVQGSQVLALKQAMNFLYYAHELLLELEKIYEDDQSQTLWEQVRTLNLINPELKITHIVQCVAYVSKLNGLGQSLVGNPYFAFIYKDVMAKLQPALATIGENIDPYIKGADQVEPKLGTPAEYSGLWYTLNALSLLPGHIDQITGQSTLSSAQMEERIKKVQEATKIANMKIERIIKDANSSYFKLLQDVPMAYPLFRESLYNQLVRKIQSFTKTTNQAVHQHIEEIYTQVFNQTLLEIDEFETKLGLAPGTISAPIKEILDEYYVGIVQGLGFSFQKEARLIDHLSAIKKRHDVVLANLNQTLVKQREGEQNVEKLNELLRTLETFDKSQDERACYGSMEFVSAMPLLEAFQAHCRKQNIALPFMIENFNAVLYPTSKSGRVKFKKLVGLCRNYYEGQLAPHQIASDLARSQLIYFEKLRLEQIESNAQYRKDYAKTYFAKKLDTYCSRTIGLVHLNGEYHAKLKEHLLQHQAEVLAAVARSEEIDLALDQKIAQKVSEFESMYVKSYYQLDATIEAIHQFKVYLTHASDANQKYNSELENIMLRKKNAFINELETIAFAVGDVRERFRAVKDAVESRGGLLTHYEHSKIYDFKWFKQRFIALLVSLNLYTTQRKAHLRHLQRVVSKEPKLGEYKDRFGLLVDLSHASLTNSIPNQVTPAAESLPVPDWSIREFFAISESQLERLGKGIKLTPAQIEAMILQMNNVLQDINVIFMHETPAVQTFLAKEKIYGIHRESIEKFELLAACSTRDDVIQILEALNHKVFTNMLLAADEEEEIQQLVKGTLSEPLKLAIDHFFDTMVEILSFDFHTKQRLLFSPVQTQERIAARLARLDSLLIESYDIKANHLLDMISSYNPLDSTEALQAYKAKLNDAYRDIQPILQQHSGAFFQQNFNFQILKHNDLEYIFDEIMNVLPAYLEENKRLKLQEATCIKEQLIAINQFQQSRDKEKEIRRINFARANFKLEFDKMMQRPLGLTHLDDQYKQNLNEYLSGLQPLIIQTGLKDELIPIKELVLKKVKKFETEYIVAFHQLERVIEALNQFEAYLNQPHVLQDPVKIAYIHRLKTMALNEHMDVTERYRLIKEEVRASGQTILLGKDNASTPGFGCLVACLVYLLESLHLFTPAKKRQFAQLSQSLEESPNIGALAKRFSIFYDPNAPLDEQPDGKLKPKL